MRESATISGRVLRSASHRSLRPTVTLATLGLLLGSCTVDVQPAPRPDKESFVPPAIDRNAMVHIESGTFSMGLPPDDPGMYGKQWKENEMPAHAVTLSEFWMDADEVTHESFASFLTYAAGEKHYQPLMGIVREGSNGYRAAAGHEQRPVNYVSWLGAAEYCAWLGKRLPTEAEWERAAKSTDERRWPWGESNPNCNYANHYTGASYCADQPVDVGSYSPAGDSEDGVRDLAGNVAEWTNDYYAAYAPEEQTDPTGPTEGWERVVRGGGYNESAAAIRTTARWGADPELGSPGIGFRCVVGP